MAVFATPANRVKYRMVSSQSPLRIAMFSRSSSASHLCCAGKQQSEAEREAVAASDEDLLRETLSKLRPTFVQDPPENTPPSPVTGAQDRVSDQYLYQHQHQDKHKQQHQDKHKHQHKQATPTQTSPNNNTIADNKTSTTAAQKHPHKHQNRCV